MLRVGIREVAIRKSFWCSTAKPVRYEQDVLIKDLFFIIENVKERIAFVSKYG